MKSDKTLATQIQFLLDIQRMENFPSNGDYVTSQQRERSIRRTSKINQHFLNLEIPKVLKILSFYLNNP